MKLIQWSLVVRANILSHQVYNIWGVGLQKCKYFTETLKAVRVPLSYMQQKRKYSNTAGKCVTWCRFIQLVNYLDRPKNPKIIALKLRVH